MAMPKHIAISLDDVSEWCRKSDVPIKDACARYFWLLGDLLKTQVKLNIPILSIYLLPENAEKTDYYLAFLEFMGEFFNELQNKPFISEQKIKISVFGKWYNLPGKVVESLKKAIEETKEYDSFFANFCINYDGKEEIVDACKLVSKQVQLGKLDPGMITREIIKENIYSSYFLPPDLILIYGERNLSGLLLWDSANSRIEFADKSFMEFKEEDIEKFNRNLFK